MNMDRKEAVDCLQCSDCAVCCVAPDIASLNKPAGVPCGPINTLDRVFDDPQINARGMRVKIPHALGVDVEYAGNPIRFSASPVDYPLSLIHI